MNPLIESARNYYAGKFHEFGPTHCGVDWNSTESQELRFTQLLKVCGKDPDFELNDLGCGYAALYEHVKKMAPQAVYKGYDICAEMIDHAKGRLAGAANVTLFHGNEMSPADYTVASGVLHVKLGASDEEWLTHVYQTIDQMNAASRKGFAFNLLTKYSDTDRMRADLYYADPCYFFDYLKRKYAFNVALLHDYGLWEFTLIVRKTL
jgi:hypothetical protein